MPGEALEIVSPLPGLVSKHGLWVTPFVALMNESTVLKPNFSEVSEVFEVPIAWLQDDPRMTTERLERQGEVQMAPVIAREQTSLLAAHQQRLEPNQRRGHCSASSAPKSPY